MVEEASAKIEIKRTNSTRKNNYPRQDTRKTYLPMMPKTSKKIKTSNVKAVIKKDKSENTSRIETENKSTQLTSFSEEEETRVVKQFIFD